MRRSCNHSPVTSLMAACALALLACGLLAPPAGAVVRDLDANNNGVPDWLDSAPSITLVGHLGEANPVDGREDSYVTRLTRDGQFAVGLSFQSADYTHEAVRYGADGILPLGAVPGQARSAAQAVAEGGGTVLITNGGGVWREEDLPGYPGTAGITRPSASANASVITPDAHWAASGANFGPAMRLDLSVHPAVIEALPNPPPHPPATRWGQPRVAGIRDDGRVIVGYAHSLAYRALRWEVDDSGTWTATEILPNETQDHAIYDASPDTLQTTGYRGPYPNHRAIRLRSDTGELLELPSLGDCVYYFNGRGISADGATIVGWYISPVYDGFRNFIWREGHGTRDLQAVLAQAYGLEVAGYRFNSDIGITPDGRLINGRVEVSDGVAEGYVAHLDPADLAAEAAVVFDPCVDPVDSDGDGVDDPFDLCPGTAPNDPVDAGGCSEAQRGEPNVAHGGQAGYTTSGSLEQVVDVSPGDECTVSMWVGKRSDGQGTWGRWYVQLTTGGWNVQNVMNGSLPAQSAEWAEYSTTFTVGSFPNLPIKLRLKGQWGFEVYDQVTLDCGGGDLITNGSFESPEIDDGTWSTWANPAPDGWTTVGGGAGLFNPNTAQMNDFF